MKKSTLMVSILTMVVLMTSNVQVDAASSLPPCPAKPNCVSSQAADDHRIEPFKIVGEAEGTFNKLRDLLARRSDTKLVSSDDTTIRVEFRTFLGFVDDGLFLLDSATGTIHIRSAARLGYWDLGKNRSRMEEIRQTFERVQLHTD
jgi:uncharacterized protein (DUF1499 family)